MAASDFMSSISGEIDEEDRAIAVVVDMPSTNLPGTMITSPEELRLSLERQQRHASDLARMLDAVSTTAQQGISIQIIPGGQGIRISFDSLFWSVDAVESWMRIHSPRDVHVRLILPLSLVNLDDKPAHQSKEKMVSSTEPISKVPPPPSSSHSPSSSWDKITDYGQTQEPIPHPLEVPSEPEEVQQFRQERIQTFLDSLVLHQQTYNSLPPE